MISSQSVTLSVFLSLLSESAFCEVLIIVLTLSPPTTSLLFHKTLNIPLTVNSALKLFLHVPGEFPIEEFIIFSTHFLSCLVLWLCEKLESCLYT